MKNVSEISRKLGVTDYKILRVCLELGVKGEKVSNNLFISDRDFKRIKKVVENDN